jgi:hypothetical protein
LLRLPRMPPQAARGMALEEAESCLTCLVRILSLAIMQIKGLELDNLLKRDVEFEI